MENLKNRMHSRGAMVLSLGLWVMLVAQPSQAEFYKWTDESGQVHYTQTPPPEHQAEKVRVDTRTPAPVAMPPTEKGEVNSCGSITLPAKRLDPLTNIAMFRQAIAVWQKYIDENGANSDEASRQGVTDRRCAIEYANRELLALSEIEQDINTNYERARDELEELQQSVEACGDVDRVDDGLPAAECKRQYQSRITGLKKMLRTLEASKKMIEPGE